MGFQSCTILRHSTSAPTARPIPAWGNAPGYAPPRPPRAEGPTYFHRPPAGRRMKQLTLTHILRRSLLHRRARSISALVALTVSAGVATALLTLYADLDNKLHKEFRSFGANIVVTAPNNAALPPDTLAKVQQ